MTETYTIITTIEGQAGTIKPEAVRGVTNEEMAFTKRDIENRYASRGDTVTHQVVPDWNWDDDDPRGWQG